MPNPFDQFDSHTGPVYGLPRTPPPQTPAQATGDQLGIIHQQQQIEQVPLQNESTRVNIEQGRQSLGNTEFTQKDKLRSDYQALPPVKTYNEFLPALFKAVQAPDNAQGDLAVLISFSKAMDPTTGVKEGEAETARNTASMQEQAQLWVTRVQQGQRLPPEVRHNFVETMRETGRQYARSYGQQRQFYTELAKRNHFDPFEVVGPDSYAPFANAEESYVVERGGTPSVEGVPTEQPGAPQPEAKGRFGDDFGADGTRIQFNDEAETRTRAKRFHDDLYNALADRQIKSPADVNAWVQRFNQQNHTGFAIDWRNKDTRLAIRAAMTGKKFGVETPPDPAVQQKVDQYKAQRGIDATDAYNVGAEDAVTVGTAPRIAAAGAAIRGSLSGDGSFGDLYNVNVDANRQYMDTLQEQHPYASAAGELTGGLALPGFGARTPAQMALLGLGYGGAYGANQGDSSTTLTQRAGNAAVGAAAGAATGYLGTEFLGAGRMGQALADRNALLPRPSPRTIPPLVDPATGELNQPMDAMRPGERVQAMRDYGMETITPGMAGGRSARVVEQGFNNLPGSAGTMEDVNNTAAKELRRSMQGVAQQFGSSKTLNEGGSELQRGAKEWMTRFDGVTSKAYNAIPIAPAAPTNLNNTKATLEQLAGKLESNPALQEEIRDPTLLRYLDAINKNGLSWQDLKDFRTFVGNKIGQFRLSEDARTGDYRSLYAALSEDMRSSASAQGPHALHAFDRANSLYREGQQRIDQALTRILGPDTKGRPELAAAAIQAMTKGGKSSGDLRMLAQVKAATVKSGAWDEIASTLIHLGGQPANSEGRAFQPATFVNWYSDMSEPARRMLFKPELRKSLDGFVAMTQQLGRIKGLNNTSNTAPVMFGGGALLTASAAVLNPVLGLKLGGTIAANYGLGKLWTNPKFVNLITGYGRAAASGNQNAVKSQVGRLSKLAATNPELRSPIEHLLKSLANDNAVPAVAASTEPHGNQQN